MSNVLFSYPNRAGDNLSYSGGGFTTTLPVTFLQTRQLSQVARTMTTLARHTYFYGTASSAFTAALFALQNHNLLPGTGQWRVRNMSVDPRPAVSLLDHFAALGTLPAGWSISRGGVYTGTYIGSDGLLKTAASLTSPRYEYTSAGVLRGLLVESSRANSAIRSREFSHAAWVKTSTGASSNVTGIDGVAASAWQVAASLANATIIQGVGALGGLPVVFSVWLKRVSGTGNIQLTVDNGATWTTVGPLTSSWVRYSVAGTANAGGNFGIRIVTSGDVIQMDAGQAEQVSTSCAPSSFILTTTAAVVRAADALTYSGVPASLNWANGAMLFTGTLISRPSTSNGALVSLSNGTNAAGLTCTTSGAVAATYQNAGAEQLTGLSATYANGTDFSVSFSWAANDGRASFDGAAALSDASLSVPTNNVPNTLAMTPSNNLLLYVRDLRVYAGSQVNADLVSLSGAEQEVTASWDSGLTDAWPAAWVAATADEQRQGLRGNSDIQTTNKTGAYWRVDMKDTGNTSGYLQAGRFHAGPIWQAAVNMDYGASIGYKDRDLITETDSGSEYGQRRPAPRLVTFTLQHQSDAVAMLNLLEMQRQLGSWGEYYFMWDPADTTYRPYRAFPARMERANPLALSRPSLWSTSYTAKELL